MPKFFLDTHEHALRSSRDLNKHQDLLLIGGLFRDSNKAPVKDIVEEKKQQVKNLKSMESKRERASRVYGNA